MDDTHFVFNSNLDLKRKVERTECFSLLACHKIHTTCHPYQPRIKLEVP